MNTDEWFMDGHKLPQPLPKDETYKLIQLAATGSEEARDKLITHNIRLVLYEVSNKFLNVDYDKKDLVSIGNIGLLKAIDTYDVSKGFEFAAYAARCIDNEILMFLRKLKKHQNTDSIDRVVFRDKDGSELKLEDKLSDGSDLVEDHEQKETHNIIRKLVKELPDRDKEIVMLHFGFYNDRIYTQKEIADKFNISQSYVSRLIIKIVKRLGKQLEAVGVIELHEKPKTKEKKGETTIATSEVVKPIVDESKQLVQGQPDLSSGKVSPMTSVPEEIKGEVEGELISKVEAKEETPVTNLEETSNDITKSDCLKILELLRTPTFTQMMSVLTAKDSIIISLKLRYVDGKYFSTESIAQFLGIEEKEVIETAKKVLLLYKENIKKFLDSIIEVATDPDEKGRVLSIKPIIKK